MIRLIRHTRYLILLLVAVSLAACDKQLEREICDYKVQLRYDYNEENTRTENRIEYFVYTIDEYIFREDGILFQHRTFTADRCTEHLNSEIDLPPGRYSVIAIGNKDERSEVYDADPTRSGTRATRTPTPGVTHRDYLRMTLNNCGMHEIWADAHGPSEKLYHGYKTFTVKEHGISRVRVDMVNAHFTLNFRVTWKNGVTPTAYDSYYALFESVPSNYKLMPEWIYPAQSYECKKHDCDGDDLYPDNCNAVIHHIPFTNYSEMGLLPDNRLCHRYDTYVNADLELWGEFIAYRLQGTTQPMLKILNSSGQSIIPRDIDMQAYFDWEELILDTELKQEYNLNIVIDGDKIEIKPLDVADWDEGGNIQ